MRGVRPLLVGALLVGACIAACSSFDGQAPDADGGVTIDDASVVDQLVGDAPPLDAGLDAADADAGVSDMVTVDLDLVHPFRIDREEVTAAQYNLFLSTVADAGYPSIPGCHDKESLGRGPFADCLSGTVPGANEPIRCVDWCDAVAYCKWKGKRLCGKLGADAGMNMVPDESNPMKSQWVLACSGSLLTGTRYPYPTDSGAPDQLICNTKDSLLSKAVDVSLFPNCIGGVPGLHDMSGNVEEWVDSCTGVENGSNDNCAFHGGNYDDAPELCSTVHTDTRASRQQRRGFRCCQDLP